jgi:hypothetical protein
MSNTVKNGKGDKRRITEIDDDAWDLVFKRKKQNTERNRYKRSGDYGKK